MLIVPLFETGVANSKILANTAYLIIDSIAVLRAYLTSWRAIGLKVYILFSNAISPTIQISTGSWAVLFISRRQLGYFDHEKSIEYICECVIIRYVLCIFTFGTVSSVIFER